METQKAWVDEMLKQHRQAPYVFAVFHEPLFSAKASRLEDTAQRRAFWGDIFERNQVQVAFNGHDHHYHHAVHGGTHYVVTGGGGASLYEVDAPQPETVKATKIEHYLRIEVGPEETKLTAIDIEGETIEEFEVPRRK
ncbi:MAG: metallophosphoesterase [Candidatus Hydrogenedentes bacterium]|nr:metallophosphoesterase [Candidatus Hydrogenedentota bacterium]